MEETKLDRYGYNVLRLFALTHNYNGWIYSIFKPYVGNCLMEVGCGLGNMTQYFKETSGRIIGLDISQEFLDHLKIDLPDIELYNIDITDKKVLSLRDKNIDTVVCINVLEHIEDDSGALANIYGVLAGGGRLLLFLPALKGLYGEYDRSVKHFRRYGKKDIETKLKNQGFQIEKSCFSNFLGLFGWFLNGTALKRKKFPMLQTILFDKFIPLIAFVEKYIKPPIGMSLIIVAKKP